MSETVSKDASLSYSGQIATENQRHKPRVSRPKPGQGVLLLAHGGPGSLDDIPSFLEHVRSRPSPASLIAEVTERYRLIGGSSPLPRITYSTAKKLAKTCGLPVYVGMRTWKPFIEDAIAQMAADGVREGLAICLSPHYSACSTGEYHRRVLAAAAASGISFELVDSWHTLSPYVEGLAQDTGAVLGTLDPARRQLAHVVFSAHSLPVSALGPGDPYVDQLRETAELVAERLCLPAQRWTLAYQGANRSHSEWLGPSVEEVVLALADTGCRDVVLCPFGFVADQLEVLYDLDVVLQETARERGVVLKRAPLLNDHPPLIEALVMLVRGWKEQQS